MYKFQNTTRAGVELDERSAESLSFNGKWLEDEIPGFRLLSTSGRELMEGELTTRDLDGMDGSFYIDRRYPSRTITNNFLIKASTDREYREAFNKLNLLLSGEQKKIIYADEPDKYFIGSLSGISEPEPGRNCVTGSFDFLCTDPCKYSTTEKPFPIEAGTVNNTKVINIKNEGTVAVPIRYELTMDNETGYVGIASAQGAMEFGKRDEPDGVYDTRNEQLLNWNSFKNQAAMTGDHLHGMRTISVAPDTGGAAEEWLEQDFGTGAPKGCASGGWCYSLKRIQIPKDSLGGSGAKKFHFKAKHWLGFASPDQIGEQVIQFLDSSGKELCAYGITKGAAGMAVELYFRVNGTIRQTIRFASLPDTSPFCDGSRGWQSVEKDGGTFTFFWMGTRGPSFRDDSLKDAAVDHIDVYLGHRPGKVALTRNYVRPFYFVKTVTGTFNVRNTFFPGTRLTIDGNTSTFKQDGTAHPEMEVLGTNWFKAQPGDNKINVCFSTWFGGKVTGMAYIREAWL